MPTIVDASPDDADTVAASPKSAMRTAALASDGGAVSSTFFVERSRWRMSRPWIKSSPRASWSNQRESCADEKGLWPASTAASIAARSEPPSAYSRTMCSSAPWWKASRYRTTCSWRIDRRTSTSFSIAAISLMFIPSVFTSFEHTSAAPPTSSRSSTATPKRPRPSTHTRRHDAYREPTPAPPAPPPPPPPPAPQRRRWMARRADGAEIATSAKSLRSPTRPSAKLQLPCTYERAAPDVCA